MYNSKGAPVNQPGAKFMTMSPEDVQGLQFSGQFGQTTTLPTHQLAAYNSFQGNQQLMQQQQMQQAILQQQQMPIQLQQPQILHQFAVQELTNVIAMQQADGSIKYFQAISSVPQTVPQTIKFDNISPFGSVSVMPSAQSTNEPLMQSLQLPSPVINQPLRQVSSGRDVTIKQETANDHTPVRMPQQPSEDADYYNQPIPSVRSEISNEPGIGVEDKELNITFVIQNNDVKSSEDASKLLSYASNNEVQQLKKLLITLAQRKAADVIGHRQEELEKALQEDPNTLQVSKMRKYITEFMKALYLPDDDRNKSKIKHLWENKPERWPKDVPFVDPNNGKKQDNLKKPNKNELLAMFIYLTNEYKQRRLIASMSDASLNDGDCLDDKAVKFMCQPDDNTFNQNEQFENSFNTSDIMAMEVDTDELLNSLVTQPQHGLPNLGNFGIQSISDSSNFALTNIIDTRGWVANNNAKDEEKKSGEKWIAVDENGVYYNIDDGTPLFDFSSVSIPQSDFDSKEKEKLFDAYEQLAKDYALDFTYSVPSDICHISQPTETAASELHLAQSNNSVQPSSAMTGSQTGSAPSYFGQAQQQESYQYHTDPSLAPLIPTVVEDMFAEGNSSVSTNNTKRTKKSDSNKSKNK